MKCVMIDASLCTGCLNCTMECMSNHRDSNIIYDLDATNPGDPLRNRTYQRDNRYFSIFYHNCNKPDCASVCMSGVLRKDEESRLVLYDETVHVKCFMRVMAYRYGHPRSAASLDKMIRCDFYRNTKEKEPQCVKACPIKAIEVQGVSA